jgi:putative flippase GtrA
MTDSAPRGSLSRLLARDTVVRVARFGVVGLLGVVVNLAVSEFFFRAGFSGIEDETSRLAVANAIGVVVSIFTNFLLNDRWTWGDRAKGDLRHWFSRLFKYYVLASVAGLVQVGVSSASFELVWQHLPVRIAGFEIDSTLSICTGIGAGMVINFVASHFWAFRDVEEE